jgi:hypothetical protein
VKTEIRPEPTPEERAAIDVALACALHLEPDARGAWWRLGVREALAGAPPLQRKRPRRG